MMKYGLKIVPIILILSAGIFQPVSAFDLKNVNILASVETATQKIGDFLNFFGETVINRVRSDFCKNYFSSLASGEWKKGEFREKLGSKVCSEYVALKIDAKIQKSGTTQIDKTAVATSSEIKNIENPVLENTAIPQTKVEAVTPIIGETEQENYKINLAQIISFTNLERTKNNFASLKRNSVLDSVALMRVKDMFEKGYFEHISPTGDCASVFADKLGYKYIIIGENIAIGNYDNASSLVNAWMDSEGHRKNILNQNFTEIGVAALESNYKNQKVWISAQIFSKPLSGCIEPSLSNKVKIEQNYVSVKEKDNQAKKLAGEIKNIDQTINPNLYNFKVAEYNSLVRSINNLIKENKNLIENYNSQVTIFNECIKIK